MEKVPIRMIDHTNTGDAGLHIQIVALVERALELSSAKRSGKLAPSELQRLEREIAATDAEIDKLVYELYGITGEERRIIEGVRDE